MPIRRPQRADEHEGSQTPRIGLEHLRRPPRLAGWTGGPLVREGESLVEAATRKEIKRIKLESVPLGIVFTKDGRTAFVTAVQNDVVLKIDLEKAEVTGRATAGLAPDGVAVAGL